MTTIERIAGKGIGAYEREFELDLRPYQGKLVCVCGENGGGKSTLLEAIPGAMFRKTPSQGPIGDLAGPDGGWLEIDVVTDQPYRIRQVLPASSRATSFVWDASGVPQIESADVSDFDSWADHHLPDQEVYYTSDFAAQGAAPFAKVRRLIDERAAKRKDILLRALGVWYLEDLAVRARAHAVETDKQLSAAKALVAEVGRNLQQPDKIRTSIDMLVAQAALCKRQSDEAQQRIDRAQADLTAAVALDSDARSRRERIADLSARIEVLVGQIEQTSASHAQAQLVIQRADEIAASQERLAGLRARLDELHAEEWRVKSERNDKRHEAEVATNAERAATERAKAATSAERLQAMRDELRSAVNASQRLAQHSERIAEIKRQVAELEREIERLRSVSVHGAFDRIEGLADALGHISKWEELEGETPETPERAVVRRIQKHADDALWADTEMADTTQKAPKVMESTRVLLAKAREELEQQEALRSAAQVQAAREADLRQAITQAEASVRKGNEATREAASHAAAAKAAGAAADAMQIRLDEIRALCEDLAGKIAEIEPTLRDANVERARAEADSLLRNASALEAEMDSLAQQKRDLGDVPESTAVPEAEQALAEARRLGAGAAEDLRDAEWRVERARATLSQVMNDRARHEELQANVARLVQEMSDWSRLGKWLGKNGVQGLEIDATGPELSAKANDLLHTCYGTRWTISIATSERAATRKRGDIEGFYIRVMDTERRREGFIESYSGGERVLLGEAVALALTIISSRRNKTHNPTLVRDEAGAALSDDRASAYVAMLRRAADEIGAHCVLFVSHNKAVQEMSDVRVWVDSGALRIE